MGLKKQNQSPSPEYCFSALKLLELLNKEGQLPGYIFRNILNDYKGVVDITQFTVTDKLEVAA